MESNDCVTFSDSDLIRKISSDADYLLCIHNKTKDYCIKFMQKQCAGIDYDELRDIYHDAVLVIYDKAKAGKLELTCSLQTYLNSVCRNQLLNKFKNDGKISPFPDSDEYEEDENYKYLPRIKDWLRSDEISINGDDTSEIKINALVKGLKMMKSAKGNCYDILTMVYWQNRSMQQIADLFDYKDEQNARNKAYKCREKLKDITFGILNGDR